MPLEVNSIRRIIVELVCTSGIVCTISMTGNNAVSVGLIIYGCMVFSGMVSGGQFNPAITLGFLLKRLFSGSGDVGNYLENLLYVVAQIAGALLGGLWAWMIDGDLYNLDLGKDVSIFQAISAEASYSFLIVAVALMVETNAFSVTSIAVPLSYVGSIEACKGISKGIFNPSVALGINFLNLFYGNNIENIFAYIIGPCIGALLASLANIFVRNAAKHEDGYTKIN